MRELDASPPFELVEILSERLRQAAGASSCVLLLADYAGTTLEPVPGLAAGPVTIEAHRVDDSSAGEAFRTQRPVEVDDESGRTVFLPVSVRWERLGVLAVTRDRSAPDGTDLTAVAQLLGYVIAEARRYTDRFERVRRRRDLELPAEIQWELLPVLAYEDRAFSIAGNLEPAYEIGGDTFDYAVDAGQVTAAINDAMGHGLQAALMASLSITTQRNVRRCGGDFRQQTETASARLLEQFPDSAFVTSLMLQLDEESGRVRAINAGHPPPLLLRDGELRQLDIPPDPPLGILPALEYTVHDLDVRPGDRLLLLSDGILDGRPRKGAEDFGIPRVAEVLTSAPALPATELVRLLTTRVLDYCDGKLPDDATAVCLDWFGPVGERRQP